MNRIYVLITLLLLICCEAKMEESVDFLEPQPSGFKEAYAFTKKYQGSYINPEDSSGLLILPDKIIKTVHRRAMCLRNELDSSFQGDRFRDSDIVAALKKYNMEVTSIAGDSIHFVWSITDTLFSMSPQHIAKHYKGAYFLNYTEDQLTWKVQRMDLTKNRLSIGMIMPNDSLFTALRVKDRSEIRNDTGHVINYKIKPSPKELKRLIKGDAFGETEAWIKQ